MNSNVKKLIKGFGQVKGHSTKATTTGQNLLLLHKLYEIGEANGIPVGKIYAAIGTTASVGSYQIYKVAAGLGEDVYNSLVNSTPKTNMKRLRATKEEPYAMKNRKTGHESTALSNSPAKATMQDENMGGAPEEGGEQQISPVRNVWTKFPNTQDTKLKWVYSTYLGDGNIPAYQPFDQLAFTSATTLQSTTGGAFGPVVGSTALGSNVYGYDFIKPFVMQIRMTSPYSILKNLGGTPQNGLGSQGNSQPSWIELFDQKYQYYHVIDTEWELTLNFGIPNNGAGVSQDRTLFAYYVFWKYTNEDDPPTQYIVDAGNIANVGAVNPGNNLEIPIVQTTGAATVTYNLTPDDYFRMGGWHHKHIKLNSTHVNDIKLHGKYKFGQCKMDIKTISANDTHNIDTAAEGWAQARATPVFPENLTIHIVQDNTFTGTAGFKTPVGMRIETEQLIQWKDLQAAYKFPTPGYSRFNAGAYANTDILNFCKGAAYS